MQRNQNHDGAGCVTLVTDSNWNSNVGTVNGYFKQDNALLARQIITWLDGCSTLNLSKSAGPTPVQAGGLLTYTLTVVNNSVLDHSLATAHGRQADDCARPSQSERRAAALDYPESGHAHV